MALCVAVAECKTQVGLQRKSCFWTGLPTFLNEAEKDRLLSWHLGVSVVASVGRRSDLDASIVSKPISGSQVLTRSPSFIPWQIPYFLNLD